MTTRLHVGAKGVQGALAAYAKRFSALEVRLEMEGEAGRPKLATLRRHRTQVPPHFELVAVAPLALSQLKPGPAFEAALAFTVEAIAALEARAVLLSTPTEVTPAAVWRTRLAKLVERLPRDVTQVVWEPHGLWEPEDAVREARKIGVVVAVDAARHPVPKGPVAYVRLPQLGAARSYGEAALAGVAAKLADRREAYVFVETPTALKECKTLRRLMQGKPAKMGGGALVLKPKNPILRVRDDEQE